MKFIIHILKKKLPSYLTVTFALLFISHEAQVITKKDSLHIVELCNNIKSNVDENPKQAVNLAEEVIAFSRKKTYSLGLIRGYNYLGLIYSNTSKYKKALQCFDSAKANVKDGQHQKELGKVLYNTAILYEIKGQSDKAIEIALQSMQIKINLADSFGIASCYNLIGSNLMYNKNYEKSVLYFEKALVIQNKIKHSNIEETYNNASVVYIKLGKYKKALSYLYTALKISKANENDYLLSNAYLNIGDCYFNLNKKDSTLYYYTKSLNEAKQSNHRLDELAALNNIGRQYLKDKKLNDSEVNLKQALVIAKELNALTVLNDVQGNLADLYYAKGDFKQAFLFKEQFRISSDTLLNKNKMKVIDELSVRYETNEIETQNKNLQNEIALQKIKVEQKNYFIYGIFLLYF